MKVAILGNSPFYEELHHCLLENDFNVVSVFQKRSDYFDHISYSYNYFLYEDNEEAFNILNKHDLDLLLIIDKNCYFKELSLLPYKVFGFEIGLVNKHFGESILAHSIIRRFDTGISIFKISNELYYSDIYAQITIKYSDVLILSQLEAEVSRKIHQLIKLWRSSINYGKTSIRLNSPIIYYPLIKNKNLDFNKSAEILSREVMADINILNVNKIKIKALVANPGKYKTTRPIGTLVYEDENRLVLTTKSNDLVISKFDKLTE